MEQVFEKLNELINEYDNFVIMGHKDPDLDCLGSSLGLYKIIENFNKKAYIFLNDKHLENYNNNIFQVFQIFNQMKKEIKCVNSRTYKKILNNTLLIITDTHISDRVEYSKLIEILDVVVLDHHIKSKNYIKDTKFTYIDSNLSSMSEFISYYAKYLNINLDSTISTILLAGIEIDTNGYNLKTTSKTYEASSLLMEMGADSILKQELLKETKEEYVKRANFIRNSFMITNNIVMCVVNELISTILLSNIAQELLSFEDIKASFVIGKLDKNVIGVSSKSLGDIDVSVIIKELGGGGHISNAATQIKNKSIKEVKNDIINLLK